MISILRKFLHLGVEPTEAVVTGRRQPLGYQRIVNATIASAAAGIDMTLVQTLSGRIPGYAIIQCNGGIVRWRDDGVDPTSSVGMSIPDGGELNYAGDITKIKFIDAGTTPILDISIYA